MCVRGKGVKGDDDTLPSARQLAYVFPCGQEVGRGEGGGYTSVNRPNRFFFPHCEQEQVKRESDMNVLLREKTQVPLVRADVVKAHNYSTQTLNSTELANEALRQVLQEVGDR